MLSVTLVYGQTERGKGMRFVWHRCHKSNWLVKYRLQEASGELNMCILMLWPLKCLAKLGPDKAGVAIRLQSPFEGFEFKERRLRSSSYLDSGTWEVLPSLAVPGQGSWLQSHGANKNRAGHI